MFWLTGCRAVIARREASIPLISPAPQTPEWKIKTEPLLIEISGHSPPPLRGGGYYRY